MGGTCRVWMGEMCNMYKILIGKPKRNRSSGRPSRRWEDTIKINLKEVERAVIAQSVQHWATGWTIGVLGFDSRRGLGIFLFTTASRPALGPTKPPIQWIPGVLSLGVKWPGREADHLPQSSAEVKE
jgi:hypothetical protein